MILQALVQLAENEKLIADPDFEFKAVCWIIRLKTDGSLIAIEDNRKNINEGLTDKKGKPLKAKWVGRDVLIPIQSIRTSGDSAAFLVDKADYVLGVDPASSRSGEKLSNRLKLFYGKLEDCASSTTDASIEAAREFGQTLSETSLENRAKFLPKEAGPGDLYMFRVGDDATELHLRPAVQQYWKKLRAMPDAAGTHPSQLFCLITGKPITNIPLFKKIKNVPGDASGGLSLVSFNASAWESYGWKGEDNAPVSREAAEAAATALTRLLDSRPKDGAGQPIGRRHIRLSEDTAIVFWSPAKTREAREFIDLIPDLLDPRDDDISDVANLLASAGSGQFQPLSAPEQFFAMTLTGTTGRLIVRDWFEATLTEVQSSLLQHFEDLRCVRNTPPPKGKALRQVLSLNELMNALAVPGRDAKVPAALAADFLHAAFRGTQYPFGILQRALLRARAEAGGEEWIDFVRRDARAALLKAVLNRRRRYDADAANRYSEVLAYMDPNSTSIGYNLGALLAVMERLQAAALGNVNASIVDRYFAAASATPRVAFDRLLRNARHHSRKALDSDDGNDRGAAAICERLIDELLSRFSPSSTGAKPTVPVGIPSSLDLEQQGLFPIGYHHMRRYLWMTRQEREAWEAENPHAPRAFRRKREDPAPETLQA